MDDESPTSDEIFEILSSSRRRYLLYHLYQHDGSADLRTLAEETASVEFGSPLTEEQIKRIYIAFYQTHVPKLESAGFVDYDRDNQRVTLNERTAVIGTVLPYESEQQRSWPLYYLALAIFGIAVSIASYLDVGGIGGFVPVSIVAVLLSLALLVLTIWYYVDHYVTDDELAFLEDLVAEKETHRSTE